MPKITLYFTDSEFTAFIANNPQFEHAIRKRVKTPKQKEPTALQKAEEFISSMLTENPMDSVELTQLGELFGMSRATLHRARKSLGAKAVITSGKNGGRSSTWYLPK